ncbi:HNH endonuclease signature motif containing protein [Priestia megaterium]|uniref:HNH endonuclease n=1 Tax=Priestia megaterium TaxID=1404 RepID=UPI00203B1341|nr:HNH endonuclease signature motif containing protein [Priestia megaterium]MCM3152254.1 HNH endonuclease [Priestia megaterium]
MWGAIPGSDNKQRWLKLQPGDKILVYSKGDFLYYGTIFLKTHNRQIAEIIWGTNKEGMTWEYIYFIKNLERVSFNVKDFNEFFGYSNIFAPRGFSNIEDKRFKLRLQQYESIDEMIHTLDSSFFLGNDLQEEESFHNSLHTKDLSKVTVVETLKPEDKPLLKMINGRYRWTRDKELAKKALKRAKFQCEIDNQHISFISKASGVSYMEAHHLVPLKRQNEIENSLDVLSNIVSLCPNCHRKIHHAEYKVKKQLLRQLFEQRKEDLFKQGVKITFDYLINSYGIK